MLPVGAEAINVKRNRFFHPLIDDVARRPRRNAPGKSGE
jgi:hypothetical protein